MWCLPTIVICLFGFWKSLKPITPFLTAYLVDEKNFTNFELYSEIYPFWPYSYLVALIPVFVLTDFLRHKPVILLEAGCLLSIWFFLIWGQNVSQMRAMQCFYGLACATDVAYYAYIYTAVDESRYKRVTSFVRAAELIGHFVAYSLAQLLVSTAHVQYVVLCYITLGSCAVVLLISILLFFVPANNEQAELLHVATKVDQKLEPLLNKPEPPAPAKNFSFVYFTQLWHVFKLNYSIPFVAKWSLWWAFATCGVNQVGNYMQNIWDEISTTNLDSTGYFELNNSHDNSSFIDHQASKVELYNGLTEALKTLLGAATALCVQHLHVNWSIVGELVLGLVTLFDSLLLILVSRTNSLVIAYVSYVAYCVLYQLLMTIASFNVALRIERASHGLVFGCNTFLALLLQTFLTLFVADKVGLHLPIRLQFMIYGIYHGVMALIFLVWSAKTIYDAGYTQFRAAWTRGQNEEIPRKNSLLDCKETELEAARICTEKML